MIPLINLITTAYSRALKPRGAGLSSYLPLTGWVVGFSLFHLSNFRADRRNEERVAAVGSSEREDYNAVLFFLLNAKCRISQTTKAKLTHFALAAAETIPETAASPDSVKVPPKR